MDTSFPTVTLARRLIPERASNRRGANDPPDTRALLRREAFAAKANLKATGKTIGKGVKAAIKATVRGSATPGREADALRPEGDSTE